MKIKTLHPWDLTPKEAVQVQRELADKVIRKDMLIKNPSLIAGADISYSKKLNRAFCVLIVFSYPELKIIETVDYSLPPQFPYVPGILSFREAPCILNAVEKLSHKPDLFIFDAHGICHPRKFGLASHLGVILDIPSIGCAKSHLYGAYALPAKKRGKFEYIYDKDTSIIGAVLTTKDNCKPIFVSIGHKISLKRAMNIMLKTSGKYKIPEITRLPHILCEKIKRNFNPQNS